MNILKPAHEHAFWREFTTAPALWPVVVAIIGLAVSWALIITVLASMMSR